MSTPAPARVALVNGGFEQPQVTDYEILPDASQPQAPKHVSGWRTTASDHRIELWRDGYRGVEAKEGKQFAELNANEVSTLYQDLPTTPGTKLYWRLWHRGRLGPDTMALEIGAPAWKSRSDSSPTTGCGATTPAPTPPPGPDPHPVRVPLHLRSGWRPQGRQLPRRRLLRHRPAGGAHQVGHSARAAARG